MRGLVVIAVLAGISLLCGCSSSLDQDQYVAFVNDTKNRLHVIEHFKEFVFDVQYQPADYLKLKSTRQDAENPNPEWQYYVLNIGVRGATTDIERYLSTSDAELQRHRYHFSFHFQNDLSLEQEGVALPCLLFHAEQSLKSGHFKTFVLAFENKFPESKESKLVIKSDLFDSLPLKIKISKTTPVLRKL